MDRSYKRAREVLEKHRDRLDAIANRLVEKETIEAPELEAIVNGDDPALI